MAHRSTKDRQKKRDDGLRSEGFAQMKVWVPPGDRDEIRKLEKRIQKRHRKNQGA